VYINAARQRIEDLERILLADLADPDLERDAGWDPETLREEVQRMPLDGSRPVVAAADGA
jgi:hypothetical protein